MKACSGGSGSEPEEVLSFEKALVYCWRACIYFMPPQIVGKGRAGSVGVIREVGRELESERERDPQGPALLRYFLVLCALEEPFNILPLTPPHSAVAYWHTGRDTCLV